MITKFAADAVVLVHFGFILFVVLGGFLVLKWKIVAYFHIPCALWGALIEFTGWICPLTPLENRLRIVTWDSGYGQGFVEHYIIPLVYPDVLTRAMQVGMGIGLIVVNLLAYGLVLRGRAKKR